MSILFIAIVTTAISFSSFSVVQTAEAAISISPPPDMTIPSTGTTTKVALGSALVSGTTDPKPTLTNNALGATEPPTGGAGIWNFDNNLKDQSGNANNGITVGDAKIGPGSMGSALILDGDGDYVSVADSPTLDVSGAFSIAAWVNLATLSPDADYMRIVEKGNTGSKYWMFYIKSTKEFGYGFVSSSGDYQIKTLKTNWQAGRWYHIVGTVDPTLNTDNFKIYVDGALDNEITNAPGATPKANSQPLLIGAKNPGDWQYWQGSLDDVRIYKRALTSSEVSDLYDCPFVWLPVGANTIKWTVTDSAGSTATANQIVTVQGPTNPPVTTLTINGVRYVDGLGDTFVTSSSHFDLSVKTSSTKGTDTFYRYYKSSELAVNLPAFTKGKYFQVSGSDSDYIVEYYSADIGGAKETAIKKTVALDDTSPTATYSATSKVITAKDGTGSGVGDHSVSGIYYKLDSATSYSFVGTSTFDVSTITTAWKKIYYYGEDNVQNKGIVGSASASTTTTTTGPTVTFCASGCNYNNLQTAINSLPSTGGTVSIKDGTYRLSSTITLKSNANLVFSAGAYIIFTSGGKTVLYGNGIHDVSITGGTITAENSGVKAIGFWKTTGIHVDGTKMTLVQGSNSNAFYCSDCIDVYVSNINAKTATRLIDIKTSARDASSNLSRNIWIQNNVLTDSSIEGIKINWVKDVHVIGNKVTDTQENGIDIGFNIGSEVKSNTLIKTGMNHAAGIHPDGTNTATISNNYIETTGSTAIPVYRATHVDVLGNTIKYAGGTGITIIDSVDISSYVKVKNNHIIAPVGDGIYQSPSQVQTEIAYNTLEDIPAGEYPIQVIWSNNPTTSVHDNTVI